jgi:hypothetical protein
VLARFGILCAEHVALMRPLWWTFALACVIALTRSPIIGTVLDPSPAWWVGGAPTGEQDEALRVPASTKSAIGFAEASPRAMQLLAISLAEP